MSLKFASLLRLLSMCKVFAGLAGRIGLFMLLCLPAAHASADKSRQFQQKHLFGTRSISVVNPWLHTNWLGVLERYGREQNRGASTCGAAVICESQDWANLIVALEGDEPWDQIARVNRFVNAAPYLSDRDNYGRRDYWATPDELLVRGGDCEDYAIAKFFALRELGFSNEDLRLVVVKDTSRGTDHAVLVVYIDGEAWMLDNLSTSIVLVDWISHYRPYYSLNEANVWLHKFGARSVSPAASANGSSRQRTK